MKTEAEIISWALNKRAHYHYIQSPMNKEEISERDYLINAGKIFALTDLLKFIEGEKL
jgi:hypothetical protein